VPALVKEFDKRAQAVPPIHTGAEGDESALIAAAINGNAHAFEALIARHQRRTLVVALRRARVRQDAEDIVQQSLQKAFLHLRQFEGRSSFSIWLTLVAINEAQMLHRKSGNTREVSIDDLNEESEIVTPLEIPDSAPDPEADYSQREWRILSFAMNESPHKTRRAIKLRDLDERSTKETARIIGICRWRGKGSNIPGAKEIAKKIGILCRIGLDLWKGHERSITRDVSRKIRPRATRTADATAFSR
jgi:RNA polymerase sigma factor (sigma-70 family)